MFDRRYLKASLKISLVSLFGGLAFSLAGCASPSLVGITITPSAEYFTFSPGLTVQYTAIGTYVQGNHPKTTQNITAEVTWASNSTDVATINSTGLATTTGAAYGESLVTASMNGFTGLITAQATINVCGPGQTVTSTGCTSPSTTTLSRLK